MDRRASPSHLAGALAATLFGAATGAQPTPPAQPSSPSATRLAAAQQRLERGLGLFDRNDFATALTEFRASLDLYPSPNTRLYVGLCHLRMGHLAEAHAELQRTFNEARDRAATDPNYADARDLAQRELTELQPRLGRLVVRVAPAVQGVTITAGSTEIVPAMVGIPLSFDPGEMTVTGRAPGHRDFRQVVQLLANTTTEVTVALRPDPAAAGGTFTSTPTTLRAGPPMVAAPRTEVTATTGGGVRVAGFVVGALGLAAVGGFAALGSLAGARFDEVLTACGGRCRDGANNAAIDQGESYQLLANVSLGVGIGLSVAGVIMIAVGGPRVVDESRTARVRVRPWFDASLGALGVDGAF